MNHLRKLLKNAKGKKSVTNALRTVKSNFHMYQRAVEDITSTISKTVSSKRLTESASVAENSTCVWQAGEHASPVSKHLSKPSHL